MDVSGGSKLNAKFEEVKDLVILPGYEIKNFQRDGNWIVGKGVCDFLISVLRNSCTTKSGGRMPTFQKWLREFLDNQFKATLNEMMVGKTVNELRKEYVI